LPSYDAESGSLAFRPRHFLSLPSDPAVTSNALASRIVFPLVKGDPAFFQAGGFLGFAKQTKKRFLPLEQKPLLQIQYSCITYFLASQVPHSHGPPVHAQTPSLPGQVQPGSLLEQAQTEQRMAPIINIFFIAVSLIFYLI
jgi:hypothetical protein